MEISGNENGDAFLEKAQEYFSLANDKQLLARCEVEMSLIRLLKLAKACSGVFSQKECKEAACVVADALKLGLIREASKVCDALQDKVEYTQLFKSEIVQRFA